MAKVLSAAPVVPLHSILKDDNERPSSSSRKKSLHSNDRVIQALSFETAGIAPVTEKYRNFINNSRQRDIDSYHRMSNPYYMSPSFNKPFLNYDFKTPGFLRLASSNTILVLLKIRTPVHHRLHRPHHHQQYDDDHDGPPIDELGLQMLAYALKSLTRDHDLVHVLSIIQRHDIAFRDQGYYVTETEVTKYKHLFDTEVIPLVKSKVLSQFQTIGEESKQFNLSMNLVFDPNVLLTIESTIIEYTPNIVIFSHHEDSELDHSARKSRKSKFLSLLSGGGSPVTSYCINKLSLPVIVFTNNAIEHHRFSTSTDESSRSSASRSIASSYPSTSLSSPTESTGTPSSASQSIAPDYYSNLLKSTPVSVERQTLRSSSTSRSSSKARSDRLGSRSPSLLRHSRPKSPAPSSYKNPDSADRLSLLSPTRSNKRSVSPAPTDFPGVNLSPMRSLDARLSLSPFRSNDSSEKSSFKNTLVPYRSADAALLVDNANKSKTGGGRLRGVKEESEEGMIREKLKKSFPSFSRLKKWKQ
ncbi:hypothetical protein DASC09_041710 [Saccharomycopsis crataegensis]|uniref:UspA domain-containing protein n=1 Tax=Saccharomycopsis crataegensis TaxID=43959 RepID=A0AAV5QQM8_9ASCO|nr:hypothetical protein DASC09_041710 [Saccharomycopsis crataegensis]